MILKVEDNSAICYVNADDVFIKHTKYDTFNVKSKYDSTYLGLIDKEQFDKWIAYQNRDVAEPDFS
ncbi:MAG: hypothetical protein HUJ68_09755 [Clostridia bacterium]|nr:hypothetical protein [Clostridia bacterium]